MELSRKISKVAYSKVRKPQSGIKIADKLSDFGITVKQKVFIQPGLKAYKRGRR